MSDHEKIGKMVMEQDGFKTDPETRGKKILIALFIIGSWILLLEKLFG